MTIIDPMRGPWRAWRLFDLRDPVSAKTIATYSKRLRQSCGKMVL